MAPRRPTREMHSLRALQVKTYILLIPMILLGSVGNTILDKGIKDIGSLDLSTTVAVWGGILHVFSSATIWVGVACMLLFMVCHMLVLSWADYSFVMPFSALAYALVPLLAYLWLHEQVSATRWRGIVLIVFGVYLISRTPSRTTRPIGQSSGLR